MKRLKTTIQISNLVTEQSTNIKDFVILTVKAFNYTMSLDRVRPQPLIVDEKGIVKQDLSSKEIVENTMNHNVEMVCSFLTPEGDKILTKSRGKFNAPMSKESISNELNMIKGNRTSEDEYLKEKEQDALEFAKKRLAEEFGININQIEEII